jgi:hypothetical protein
MLLSLFCPYSYLAAWRDEKGRVVAADGEEEGEKRVALMAATDLLRSSRLSKRRSHLEYVAAVSVVPFVRCAQREVGRGGGDEKGGELYVLTALDRCHPPRAPPQPPATFPLAAEAVPSCESRGGMAEEGEVG